MRLFLQGLQYSNLYENEVKKCISQIMVIVKDLHRSKVYHSNINLGTVMVYQRKSGLEIKLNDFQKAASAKRESSPIKQRKNSVQRLINKKKGALSGVCPEFKLKMAKDVLDVGLLAYQLLNGVDQEVTVEQVQPTMNPYDGKRWEVISDECKELLDLMLTEEATMRFTTVEVLAHPWLASD